MSAIQIEVQPFCEPLSLAETKLFLRVSTTADDDLITGLIIAAREYCEMFTRRSFINKGYVQYLDSFPYFTDTIMSQQAYPPAYYSLPRYSTTLWNYSQMIKLYFSPLAAVDHIVYMDSATGLPQVLQLAPMQWIPLKQYAVGAKVTDANGTIQKCTTAGRSGLNPPAWATAANTTTTDGGATWTCTAQPAPTSRFIIDDASEPPRLFPLAGQYWPPVLYVPNAVAISFTAGFNDDGAIAAAMAEYANQSPAPSADDIAAKEASLRRADVPQVIRTAMLQCITHWYENREAVSAVNLKEVPKTVDMLLWGQRVLDCAPTRG